MSPSIAILSAAVTVFALVLSIFGASWLNQRNTEKLIEQLGQRLDQRIDSLEKRLDQRLDSTDQRDSIELNASWKRSSNPLYPNESRDPLVVFSILSAPHASSADLMLDSQRLDLAGER